MKKVKAYEPWFFIFFGIFHLHRIWGFFDRQGYADFWIGVMVNKGIFYFSLMGILAILSAFVLLGGFVFVLGILLLKKLEK